MLDLEALIADLDLLGLNHWRKPLLRLIEDKLSDTAHGHLAEWRKTLATLPAEPAARIHINRGAVSVPCPTTASEEVRDLLLSLAPWRKGPFELGDLHIDAEWQSNLKWDRLADRIEPLNGRAVLDIGCGNGSTRRI